MTPTMSNPSMELSSIPQAEDCDSIRAKAEKALDAKLQAMRDLKINQELNARATGILVNQVISGTDWSNANYNSADQCLQKKFKEIASRRNLRRLASIAMRFTDDHIRLFRTTLLDAVLTHENLTGQQMSADNLGEQEIRLKQKDGSEVVKKVKDCSANEVIRSNARVRKSAETKPVTSQYGSRSKLVLAGTGAVMLVVGELLPSWEVASVLAAIGATLLIIGGNQLIRHAFNWLKTFIRSGQALEVLAALPSKLSALNRDVVRGLQWAWSFIRSGQILHALAKLPSRVRNLGGAVVRGLDRLWTFTRGALHRLMSFRRKQTVNAVANPPSTLPSPNAGTDVSPPTVSTPPSQPSPPDDDNTKLAA